MHIRGATIRHAAYKYVHTKNIRKMLGIGFCCCIVYQYAFFKPNICCMSSHIWVRSLPKIQQFVAFTFIFHSSLLLLFIIPYARQKSQRLKQQCDKLWTRVTKHVGEHIHADICFSKKIHYEQCKSCGRRSRLTGVSKCPFWHTHLKFHMPPLSGSILKLRVTYSKQTRTVTCSVMASSANTAIIYDTQETTDVALW